MLAEAVVRVLDVRVTKLSIFSCRLAVRGEAAATGTATADAIGPLGRT